MTSTITARDVRWTVDDVMDCVPCERYTREVVEGLWDGRESIGIAEVCDLDIPTEDRVWLLCRAPWDVIESTLESIVTRAVTTYALPCEVVRKWAERWLSGEDRSEASAEAAWCASGAASAASAAASAASAAARSASAEEWAVRCKAREAARATKWAAWAAWAAGETREWLRQVEDFRALVREGE